MDTSRIDGTPRAHRIFYMLILIFRERGGRPRELVRRRQQSRSFNVLRGVERRS